MEIDVKGKGMTKTEKQGPGNKAKSAFYDEIRDKDTIVVLFYAPWCPFCQQFLPIFEEYANGAAEECSRVSIDAAPDVCEEYAVEYYPTVIVFKKGKVHKRLDPKPGVGLSRKQLEGFLKRALFLHI